MANTAPAYREHQHRWIDADLQLFRDTIRRFVETELVPNEERWWKQQHVDRDAWLKAGAIGMLCPSIPEEYGGGGGSFAHDAIIAMEQSRAIASSLGTNVHSGIVSHYLLRYGTEAQKRKWLPDMASGRKIAAIAMSEPGAGSDLKSIRTRADKRGDHYVINGAKTFITNGYLSDLIVLVAKTDPEAGSKGTSLIVVETENLQGFRRGRILEKIGQKGQDTAELFFDDVVVPRENLLGTDEGQGFYQLMQQLPQERLIIALGSIAAMTRAVDLTIEYTKQRKVFGAPLADLQNTRFKLAECRTICKVASVFVDDCMEKILAGELDSTTAAMAKWWCSHQNFQVIDECLQLHGGYGYMLEYPIARMFANSRVGRIYGGSNEIMKELIARTL